MNRNTTTNILAPNIFIITSTRRHTRWPHDWTSDVCSSDLTYHHSGLDIGWETEIPPHCFFLNSCVDSGNHPVVPGRELHLLNCASGVDKVEPYFGVCQDYYCKVRPGDPRTTGTIFRQLLDRFFVLDEYESQVLLVISRSSGTCRFEDLHLHIGRDLLRAVLSNIEFGQDCLMSIHFLTECV